MSMRPLRYPAGAAGDPIARAIATASRSTRARRGDWADLFAWSVNRADRLPVFRQIYLQIRSAILTRALRPGMRLPSTRALAARLAVARVSVVAAYEELLAEGYLTGRAGSGTYVSTALRDLAVRSPSGPAKPRAVRAATLPRHARVFEQLLEFGRPPDAVPFATGRCSLDERTSALWRTMSQRALRSLGGAHLGYADPRGLSEARAAICDYLRTARAVRCEPEQVVITSGTQQAIDLAIRVLLRPRDQVWVEDPGYPLTQAALLAAGVELRPIPVDAQGIDVARGIRTSPRARAVYVTPSHQYPLGAVLSMPRRMELLGWARSTGAWIIEDDYDSVFRYAGRPLASLQGLDDTERVIYTGSLNKMLFPGLRMGYAVVPHAVLPAYVNARNLTDRHPPSVNQVVLAEFMREGHFTAHLRRTRLIYERSRDALAAELARGAAEHLAVDVPEQGMHLIARLPRGVSDVAVAEAARESGVATRALSRTYLRASPRSGLILGFTGHPMRAIARAADRLSRIAAEHATPGLV